MFLCILQMREAFSGNKQTNIEEGQGLIHLSMIKAKLLKFYKIVITYKVETRFMRNNFLLVVDK